LEIALLRGDDTLQNRVTIWAVRVGDDLDVRFYSGNGGAWYRNALMRCEGRIGAGGVKRDVVFVQETDSNLNDQTDAECHSKYRRYPQYVTPMVAPLARTTTLKLVLRA
jgi:hypothetical protein